MNLFNPDMHPRLSDEDFEQVQRIALEEAGLMLPEGKRSMVQSRLARRLRTIGCKSMSDYIVRLTKRQDTEEVSEFISALTTNVTSFFREKHHFDVLRERIAPSILDQARSGARIRLWSAGCSTGQEAYTIAMVLTDVAPELQTLDVKILATDIDQCVLGVAKTGRYSAELISSIPDRICRKLHLNQTTNGNFDFPNSIKRMIVFKSLNLHNTWPMQGTFDVIFCRNVVIYFDHARQAALWPRFRAALKPNGWLFLGHSERIHPVEGSGFKIEGVTTYRRVEPAPSSLQKTARGCSWP